MILTVIADPLALAVEGDQGTNVGPGMGAFTVFFILAIVLWLLMRNMNARLRRMSYAQKQAEQERAEPEESAGEGTDAGAAGSGEAAQGQ